MYCSFALAGHRGTCLRPLHIFALLCFAFSTAPRWGSYLRNFVTLVVFFLKLQWCFYHKKLMLHGKSRDKRTDSSPILISRVTGRAITTDDSELNFSEELKQIQNIYHMWGRPYKEPSLSVTNTHKQTYKHSTFYISADTSSSNWNRSIFSRSVLYVATLNANCADDHDQDGCDKCRTSHLAEYNDVRRSIYTVAISCGVWSSLSMASWWCRFALRNRNCELISIYNA